MHVISKKPFNEAANQYPNERTAILDAYSVLNRGTFKSPHNLSVSATKSTHLPFVQGYAFFTARVSGTFHGNRASTCFGVFASPMWLST